MESLIHTSIHSSFLLTDQCNREIKLSNIFGNSPLKPIMLPSPLIFQCLAPTKHLLKILKATKKNEIMCLSDSQEDVRRHLPLL